MASAYLSRSISSSGSTTKGTLSVWVKKCSLGSIYPRIWTSYVSGTEWIEVYFDNSDRLSTYCQVSGSTKFHFVTTSKFRDTSGWYHIVVAYDSTQGTASNRVKMYVNGVQETAFDTSTNNTSQGDDLKFNKSSNTEVIGRYQSGGNNYFDGEMAHFHWIDGTAYAPSDFGSTDTTTGIWKPKTSPSVTYGTNGYFLKFDNAANMGLDSSGQTNNLTTSGTIIQNKDTPSNVFATMNPLARFYRNPTFSLVNSKIVGDNNWNGAAATLGFSTGKWYWEVKLSGTMAGHFVGVCNYDGNFTPINPQQQSGATLFYNHDGGEMRVDGTDTTADYGTFSSGDIAGVAVDMTAGSYGQITIYKNGVALVSNFNLSSNTSGTVVPLLVNDSATQEINFGNGYFGTTAVTSAQNPDDGNGIFEYDVPTGYRALCTKSINAVEYS